MRLEDADLDAIADAVAARVAERPAPVMVDIDEARRILGGIGETTLRGLIADGRIPTVDTGTSRVFVAVRALEQFAAGGVASPGEGFARPASAPGGASSPSAATEGPARPLRTTDPSAGSGPSAA